MTILARHVFSWTVLVAIVGSGGCGGSGGSGPPTDPPIDSAPSFGSATIADKTYTRDVTIDNETLPAATGGDGALTYSISPNPPAGLSFDSTTRLLSGTPTAVQAETTYTYRVTDSDSTNPDSAMLTFSITVNEPVPPNADITAEASAVNEWEDQIGVVLTVTLEKPTTKTVKAELRSSGTATLGGDFDLVADHAVVTGDGTVELTISAGESSVSTTLQPIRDLEEEGTETASIAIASVGGVAPSDSGTISIDVEINDTGRPMPLEDLAGDFGLLLGWLSFSAPADTVQIEAELFNEGTVASSATTGYVEARISPIDNAGAVRATPDLVDIGALDSDGELWEGSFSIPLSSLAASQNYYLVFVVDPVPEEPDGTYPDRGFTDFHVGTDGQIRTTCTGFVRSTNGGVEDPLFDDQWSLRNTGQSAHAAKGGVAGEDLRMEDTLADGPTGDGVTVAIVDQGLEICHPDLAPNVEAGRSYNFVAGQWHGADARDPFVPSLLEGDHGTSVAGVVAMAADNGIGGRGVAPDADLRGYNLLALAQFSHLGGEYDIDARELDALGMSDSNPRSDDVDIFNMSYGSAYGASKLGTDKRNALKTGVEQLRTNNGSSEPLGAIYVLAAGNSFFGCEATPDLSDAKQEALFPNAELGCISANLDPEAAWPYVIDVGAFNADGKRSSYSSVGASIWVVAPAGEDAFDSPGIISTDQMGTDRGYATQDEIDALGTATNNPDGDYTYVFGGTSAAAPNTAGAAAVVLSAEPNLTWRDVKHIFAKTARQLEPDIPQTRVAFGGKPAVLQHKWITNGADYKFHNHYGFGAIDLDRAVAMARSITPNNLGEFVQTDPYSQSPSAVIPDHDGAGVTLKQTISGLPASANIEAVQLRFQITHTKPHDLGLTLVSPAGTPSVVNHVFNGALNEYPSATLDWELLSNAFYGESPNGEWQLTVIDAAAGNTGRVDSWALVLFYGEHP